MHDTIDAKTDASPIASEASQAQDELIDRYINNRLSEPERTAFEIAMLEDEALLTQVQMVDALKQELMAAFPGGQMPVENGAENVDDSVDASAEHPSHSSRKGTAVVLPFRTWLRQPFSLAASVLVAALGLNTLYTSNALPVDSSTGISTVLLLESMRGNLVADYSGTAPYLFQIDAGPGNEAESFTFSLFDAADQSLVVQHADVPASADGWVRVVLDDTLRGEYSVELRWTNETGNSVAREFPVHINN